MIECGGKSPPINLKKNNFKIFTAFSFCTLNVESSLHVHRGKDLIYVIFNSSWDKGGIISNAGRWPHMSIWWGEGKRRSLDSQKLLITPLMQLWNQSYNWLGTRTWVSVFSFDSSEVVYWFRNIFFFGLERKSYSNMPYKGRIQNLKYIEEHVQTCTEFPAICLHSNGVIWWEDKLE